MNKAIILIGLLLVLFVGCVASPPIQHENRQCYEGVLTDTNLVPDGYTSTPGTITLGNKIVVIGGFYDIRGEELRDLTIGCSYRVLFKEKGSATNYYYIEEIKK